MGINYDILNLTLDQLVISQDILETQDLGSFTLTTFVGDNTSDSDMSVLALATLGNATEIGTTDRNISISIDQDK